MPTQNGRNEKFTLLTGLDSYIRFNKTTDQIINSFDDQASEICEMDQDLEKILKVIEMHKIPRIDLTRKSLYALLYSIITNVKANRAHHIALKSQIEALNDFINFSHCS